MKAFDKYAYYYNMFYGDKDYAAEARTVSKLIEKYRNGNSKPKTILNLGCGTGKHDVEFGKLGYQIKGIDISENMISEARNNSRIEKLIFDVGDIRTYRDNNKYDVCTSLFHVMSYQNSNNDLLAAFDTANVELNDGGLLIFDCWYGPGVLSEKPEVRIKKIEDEHNILIRQAIPVMYPERDLVDVNYDIMIINKDDHTLSNIEETHRMRYLFTPEIELMLNKSGFELLDCIDCDNLRQVTFNSWTAYFIARKQEK